MAENITILGEITAFFLQGYCLQYFLSRFLEERLTDRRKTAVSVLLLYGTAKSAVTYLVQMENRSANGFYRLLLQSVLLFILTFCFYRAARMITVFLLTTFLAVSEISFFIGYIVMSLSVPLLELEADLFAGGYIGPDHFEQILRFTAAGLQILCCVIWVLLLFLSLKKTADAFQEKDYAMQRTELLFILTPSLAGLLLCVLLRIIMVTVEDGRPALLYDKYPALRILIPAILLLSLLSILYSVKLFQDMISLSREKSSRMILEQQIDTLQEHTREIERLYGGVRSVKHDMKNTLTVLMSLLKAEDNAEKPELAAYLSELNQSFDRLELRFKTGNVVADALLSMKYHEMRRLLSGPAADGMGDDKAEPPFLFQADQLLFPENLAISSYDIGVILGNALDNAMEACVRLVKESPRTIPFVRLSSFQRGKFFFLEIENSFDGRLKREGQSEFPATMKTEKQMHGIGFANMKKTAEKYGGAVDYSVEGNPGGVKGAPGYAIFTLSIMMKGGEHAL